MLARYLDTDGGTYVAGLVRRLVRVWRSAAVWQVSAILVVAAAMANAVFAAHGDFIAALEGGWDTYCETPVGRIGLGLVYRGAAVWLPRLALSGRDGQRYGSNCQGNEEKLLDVHFGWIGIESGGC